MLRETAPTASKQVGGVQGVANPLAHLQASLTQDRTATLHSSGLNLEENSL